MRSRSDWTQAAGCTVAAAFLIGFFALFVFAKSASADFCLPGSGAGQCNNPQGIAVDEETGRVYVADQGTHRINVFEADGDFVSAFGWGVVNGQEKFQVCTVTCQAGISGSGLGQFSSPSRIAVDNVVGSATRHDVYVMDANRRLQRFDPEPLSPVLAFPVPSGNGECQFGRGGSPIAVGPGGVVYVADRASNEFGFVNRIQKFNPLTGACVDEVVVVEGPNANLTSLAVDTTENAYVGVEGAGIGLRKYGTGNDEEFLGELDQLETNALAIDASDRLFAAQRESVPGFASRVITEYDAGGNRLHRFGYFSFSEKVFGLATLHTPGGDIFANAGAAGIKYLKLPEDNRPIVVPDPCKVKAGTLRNTKATLQARVNPEGLATTVHFEYVDQQSFETEGGWSSPEVEESAESESIGSDFLTHEASADIGTPEPLAPETTYRCRVVATNADGSATGVEGTFTTLEPLEIGATWASGVGTEAATLNATVNPLGIETTGYFQYVEEATYEADVKQAEEEAKSPEEVAEAGFSHSSKAPAGEPIEFGAGEAFKSGSAPVSGLKPATAYRYRILATNPLITKEVPGPTRAFRTLRIGSDSIGLPDNRAWELASPAHKNNAEVGVPRVSGEGPIVFPDYAPINAAAGTGEVVTYTSWTSFADPEGAPGTSQYLSRRSTSGWGTQNISPRGRLSVPIPPYRAFSPDLGLGGMVSFSPPLAPEAVDGFDNLYLRDNETGDLRTLTTGTPVKADTEVCLDYVGASEDGSRAFFSADASYGGAPLSTFRTFNLYEWSASEGLRLASVLPNGNPAVPTAETAFGAAGGYGLGHCQVGQSIARHVVSRDGSRAFWTYAPDSGSTQLLVRLGGEETIQLDKKVAGASGSSGGGVFRAADAEGSLVFFTAISKLTKDSGATAGAPDLFRYDLDAEESALSDLTPDTLTPGSEPAGVKGVVGISEDGSHVYFVASGVLTEAANEAGQKAQPGQNNLYLHHEGQITFIVTGPDVSAWDSKPQTLRARVSPDGRRLAFLSRNTESLVGYDNAISEGEHCELPSSEGLPLTGSPLCLQAFLYDADSGELRCASCNPSGSRPLGPTLLPAFSNPLEGPRYLSDNGRRLFFESFDALVPQDDNGKRDVYEFELPETGTCTEESPAFDSTSGGCHYLISSGKSTDQTFLLDASSDGRDVFFATRAPLIGWDTDENYDVYDAREGGGFPEPKEPEVCVGESCKGPPPPPPPIMPSPGTAAFQGQGNLKEGRPRCRKGKVRRRGRCVKPRKRATGRKADRRERSQGKAPRKGEAAR